MSKKANSSVKPKGTHLTIEDRAKIEYGLNHGHSIRSMARSLEKPPSTIKREIERNCTILKDYANSLKLFFVLLFSSLEQSKE